MDEEHRPGTDEGTPQREDGGQPAAGHSLFNALLGKLKSAQTAVPSGQQGDVADEQPVPDEPQPEPVARGIEIVAPVVEQTEKKRPWWHIFTVKAPTPEAEDADVLGDAERIMNEPDASAIAQLPGASIPESVETEPSVFSDYDAMSAEPVLGERIAVQQGPKPGLFDRIRGIKEQLFPSASRASSDDQPQAEEPSVPLPDQGWGESELQAPAAPDAESAQQQPPPIADVSAVDSETAPAMQPEFDQTAVEVEVGPEPAPAAAPKTGLLRGLMFWKKHAEPEAPVVEAEPVATEVEVESTADAEQQPKPVAAEVREPEEEPVGDDAAADEQPTTAPTDGTPPPIKLSPPFYIREFLIAAGGLFAGLRPGPRGPIDEVLAAKLEQRRALDREIAARKRTTAALARKLRRGRYERKEILSSRSQAGKDLSALLATMKARAADVQILERQSMALQGEIQQADSRHQQQLREIDDSRLQWESLIQAIAQTKAQLDTVNVELGIKRSDAARLDQMMEQHRREMEDAAAETARLEGVRKATEEALQQFRAQIAQLDQDRNDKETYVRQATAEMERVKKLMDEHEHQRGVMESVLAQLQQDISVRQNLMQQLLDDGVRVKSETDQRLAHKDMLASSIQELALEQEQLQQRAERARAEVRSLEQASAEAAAQTSRVSGELQRLEAECRERGQQVADLREKQEVHDLLVQKIGTMKDEGLALAKKLDDLRSQKDLTEKALNSYRRELATVDTDIAQRKDERQRLGAQAKEVDARIASFRREIELYNSQKSQLSDAIEGAHVKLQSLEQQIAQKEGAHATADQRLLQVRDALSHAEGEHARLRQAVEADQRRLDGIEARHRELEQKLGAGRDEIAKLSHTGADLVAEIEANTKSKASLIAQVQELRRVMAATSQDNGNMQQQRRELEAWIKEAMPFRQQQQAAIEQQLAKAKELQQQLDGLTTRIATAEATQAGLNDDLAHLDQEKAIRSQSIEEELSRLSERLAQASSALKDAERELQERSEQRMSTIETIQKLEEERDLLKQEVMALGQQADQVKQLQAKADELAKMMAAGQKRLEEMFQENQKLAQDKAGLLQAIKQSEAEHHETRERQRAFAEEVQQVQHNLESLRQTRDDLQDDLAKQEAMLKSFLEQGEQARQALAKQGEDAQNELDERQRKLDAASEELRGVEAEVAAKTATREQLDATIAQLKQQHADALAQVAAATGGIEEQKQLVQKQLESLTAEAEKAKRTYAELDKSVKDKNAEEAVLLKRLKMLSTEAGQYQGMLKQWSELSRKIEEQKRVLEDLELQAEKKSGLFA